MRKRLSGLRSQDALCLFRHPFAIPKVLFILLSAPCFLSNKLEAFDRLLRSLLSIILNINLDHDGSWLQATLPVRNGGIGVHRVAQLAPSAILASAAGCSSLILEILPPCLHACVDPHIELTLTAWRQIHSESPPPLPESSHQRVWNAPLVAATITSLLDGAPSQQATTHLLAASTPESGAWLNMLPIPSLGLQMDDDVVRIAAGLRLGIAICHPHQCHSCGADVDFLGTHGLSCRFSNGRHCRPAAVNDIVKRSLDSARIPSHLEPSGLFRSNGRRPDGSSIVPWKERKILVWDATCPDTLATSYVSIASAEAGVVAREAEHRKQAKYCHIEDSHYFVPIAIEPLGTMGHEARCFLKELSHRIYLATEDSHTHQHLIQHLSVAVRRENAAAVHGCICVGKGQFFSY